MLSPMSSLDCTPSPESSYVDLQPAFVVGVTGNGDPLGYRMLDLDVGEAKRIREGVFHILEWIRNSHGWLNPTTWKFEVDSKPPKDTLLDYHSQWRALGLEDVPIIVLSSLAPGADTIVAEAALDYAESMGAPITVHAPLPFPLETYARSTSFCPQQSYASDADREADWTLRQRRLQVLVHRIQQQKGHQASRGIFEVSLHENMRGDAEVDLGDEKRRDLRYRAAGEYIVAHCNILLAPYDEVHIQEEKTKAWDVDDCNPYVAGAHAIVDVKRNGLTDHVLPTPNMLAWADTGPVLHLPIQRKERSSGENLSVSPLRPLALLQPQALQKRPQQKSQPKTAAQEMGDQLLRDLVNRLKDFHSEEVFDRARSESVEKRSERAEESLKKVLTQGQKAKMESSPNKKSCFSEEAVLNWTLKCQDFCFRRYALFRDEAASVARQYSTEVARAYQVLFGLATLSICFFIVSSSDLVGTGVVEPLRSLHWFGTAVVFFLVSLITTSVFRNSRRDDQHFDCRALAEGLRVQFYWALAGIASSVSNRYGQRLFGELSWIRSAINSVSFPAGRTKPWFDGQSLDDRLSLLCAVHASWIRPQLKYFCDQVDNLERKQIRGEFLGKSLFAAGVLMAVFKAWLDTKKGFITGDGVIPTSPWVNLIFDEATAKTTLWIGGLSSLAILISIGGLYYWVRETFFKQIQTPFEDTHEIKFQEIEPLLSWLFATARRSRWATWVNRVCLGALALGLACCLTALTLDEGSGADVSSAFTGCLKGAVLAASGLLLFWGEKNFYAENHRRYGGMRDLFHAADLRIQAKLDCVEGGQPDDDGKRALIRGIQQLLESLGVEVLSENADWLIMRRTRRIEPPEVVS